MPKYLFRRLTCNWSAYDIRISTSDGGSLGNNIFCRGYGWTLAATDKRNKNISKLAWVLSPPNTSTRIQTHVAVGILRRLLQRHLVAVVASANANGYANGRGIRPITGSTAWKDVNLRISHTKSTTSSHCKASSPLDRSDPCPGHVGVEFLSSSAHPPNARGPAATTDPDSRTLGIVPDEEP